jgi:hypothetical protein
MRLRAVKMVLLQEHRPLPFPIRFEAKTPSEDTKIKAAI